MTSAPVGTLQAAALQRGYAEGAFTPADVVGQVEARIVARSGDGVWITREPLAALLTRARELSAAGPVGLPLFGLPFAVKDNIDVAGVPTTAACPDFAYVPAASATIVAKLVAAGAIYVGKVNLDQFATGLNGTRTPYGIPRSPLDEALISGGSSSGSAVAVSAGLVTFALGTDTAGSGRVPGAMTGTVGIKPSLGLVSCAGVVPACRSLDCPSVHALSVADAAAVLAVIAGPDEADAYTRALPLPPRVVAPADPEQWRVGVPATLDFSRSQETGPDVDEAAREAFAGMLARLKALGATLVPVDLTPFLEAGTMLYGGPWVAERLAGVGDFTQLHPASLHPVTRQVLDTGGGYDAVELFRAQHRLQELRARTHRVLAELDFLVLPTVPTTFTVEELKADPIARNAVLGRWTTFTNLLDLAAVAVPQGFTATGRPHAVTLMGPAGSDAPLAAAAQIVHHTAGVRAGATEASLEPPTGPDGTVLLAVVGAHLLGQPLHPQLVALGAERLADARTAQEYRMVLLPGEVARPGLIRTVDGGAALEAELYRLPVASLGHLMVTVAPPLAIGTVVLEDGTEVLGFVCEGYAALTSDDITHHGGWRAYLSALAPSP